MSGPAGRLDAVLVCGGKWHDFDFARLQLLAALGGYERVRTRVFEDYRCTGALDRADLLVTYTCDVRPTAEQAGALTGFVERGGRWLALHGTHSAIDPPDGPGVYRTPRVLGQVALLLGGQFLAHPPIEPYTVHVTAPGHPLVAGLPPFEVRDELYVLELHPPIEVLLHARFTGECRGFEEGHVTDDEPRPVLYLKRSGRGTVCYLTLGHCRGRFDVQDLGVDDLGQRDFGSWDVPEFRTVLARCLAWAVTGKFPEEPAADGSGGSAGVSPRRSSNWYRRQLTASRRAGPGIGSQVSSQEVRVATGPTPPTTRIVTLASRPRGRPTPANFGLDEQSVGEPGPGQLLVRNAYMSVDPAMRGRMEPTEKHYTTNFTVGRPLDGSAVGRVIDSRAGGFAPGDFVRHRLGWRDYAVVDAAAATIVDPALAPLPAWLGVLGQPGLTAYVGLRRAGDLREGDVVFVSAAAGAVGSAAGQFARLLGASRVIGSAGGAEKARILTGELGFDEGIDYRAGIAEGLAAAAPDGIDLYFDNVGGDHLVAALYALNVRGRVALCGMISTLEDASACPGVNHLIQAVLKRLTITGFIVRDHEDLRPEFEKQVAHWLRTGELVARQTVVDGLENAVGAFLGLLSGANVGKMLVRLSDDDPA